VGEERGMNYPTITLKPRIFMINVQLVIIEVIAAIFCFYSFYRIRKMRGWDISAVSALIAGILISIIFVLEIT
jgi:hypothetical protein